MPFGQAIRGMAGQGQGLGPSQNMGGGNGLMGMMSKLQMQKPQGGQMVKGNANAMSKMFGQQPQPIQMNRPPVPFGNPRMRQDAMGMDGGMPGNRFGQMMGRGLGPQMGMGRPMQQPEGPPQGYSEGPPQGQEIARGMGGAMGQLNGPTPQQDTQGQEVARGMGPSPQGIAGMFGRPRQPQMGQFKGY